MKKYSGSVSALFTLLLVFITSCSDDELVIVHENYSEEDACKSVVETITTNVATGFGSVFDEMIDDSTERAHFVQAFTDEVRYFEDSSGYLFVETTGGWSVAHPINKSIQGSYRLDVQDINGKFYHHDFIETAKHIGYGFVQYYFNDPSTNTIEKKLTFLKIIPGAEWFVASGFYGARKHVFYRAQEIFEWIAKENVVVAARGIGGVLDNYYSDSLDRVEFLRNFIRNIRFFDNHSGYFFIYDLNHINIAHATQPDLQGKNLYDYQDSHGNYVIRDLVSIAKDPGYGFYNYYWNNPVTRTEEPKRAYVMRIPDSDLFIGSGVYLE